MKATSQTKDEIVLLLKRKYEEATKENAELRQQLEATQKGNAGSEEQIRALNEMHSQKIKTLLKSINSLKKEVQKEKFDKKDNVRIQKIQRLEKDIADMEIVIDALRREVNQEDRCDIAIKRALEKGPKRVRIASREELKMEINNFKNVSLRLVQQLKTNGLKVPSFAQSATLEVKETGVRIEAEEKENGGAIDHLEMVSVGESNLTMGGEGLEDSGIATDQQLINEKHRLEQKIVEMNKEMNEKNQKIMELLDLIEDLKIQVYPRDKTVDIQQSQLQELFEDLRDAKQFEHKCKTLQIMNNSLQKENTRLKLELEVKITSDVTTEMTTAEGKMEKETLAI